MPLTSCDSQLVCREGLCHFSVIIIVDMFYFTKFKLSSFCIEIKITKKKVEKKIKAFKK